MEVHSLETFFATTALNVDSLVGKQSPPTLTLVQIVGLA